MHTPFPTEFYIENRSKLMRDLPQGAIAVISGAGLLQRTADSTFPFIQNSSFWYLCGINEPNVVLVIGAQESYCILPQTNDTLAIFDGAPIAESLQNTSGLTVVMAHEQGWAMLQRDIKAAEIVCIPSLPPAYDEHHGMYVNPASIAATEQIKKLAPGDVIDDSTLSRAIAYNRSIKLPIEIEALKKAIAITKGGLDVIFENIASYSYEYEIEAELSKQFRLQGGSGHAFSPIVASGVHATILHYVANNGPLLHDAPTVIDVGADYAHYAADITRTYLPKNASKRHQEVYAAVERVQKYGVTLLKPGISLREYEQSIETKMGEELANLQLIANASDKHAIRTYFPHATSHFLGLDVHDVGLYDKPLEPNMVLTCEPGIYIPEEKFGVRIEDDVLITKDGNEVLSA